MTGDPPVLDPEILGVTQAEDSAELHLRVPAQLFYLRGHFPELPVLPGVVQLDWAIRYGRHYLAIGDCPAKTIQIKFRKLIHPEIAIRLFLSHTREKQRLAFEIRDEEGLFSSGRIGFGAP